MGYIQWILTESGPVIMNHDLLEDSKYKNFKNLHESTLNDINDDGKIFSFSINNELIFYNQSNLL